MSNGQTAQKIQQTVNVYDKTLELAQYMAEIPAGVDRNYLREGSDVVGVFEDSNYGKNTKNYSQLKSETLRFVIEDVGMGGQALSNNTVGLVYASGTIRTFITPLGTPAQGNVILSFNLKNRSAFQKYRREDNEGMQQELIDKALYYLAYLLAENIK